MIRYISPQKPVVAPRRGHDSYGSGAFGASRGGARKHAGVDFEIPPGAAVLAFAGGTVTKVGYPYASGVGGVNSDVNPYQYIEIEDCEGYRARYFYIDPIVDRGDKIKAGDEIGVLRSLSPRYPEITEHLHFEVRDPEYNIIDPDDYFRLRRQTHAT